MRGRGLDCLNHWLGSLSLNSWLPIVESIWHICIGISLYLYLYLYLYLCLCLFVESLMLLSYSRRCAWGKHYTGHDFSDHKWCQCCLVTGQTFVLAFVFVFYAFAFVFAFVFVYYAFESHTVAKRLADYSVDKWSEAESRHQLFWFVVERLRSKVSPKVLVVFSWTSCLGCLSVGGCLFVFVGGFWLLLADSCKLLVVGCLLLLVGGRWYVASPGVGDRILLAVSPIDPQLPINSPWWEISLHADIPGRCAYPFSKISQAGCWCPAGWYHDMSTIIPLCSAKYNALWNVFKKSTSTSIIFWHLEPTLGAI